MSSVEIVDSRIDASYGSIEVATNGEIMSDQARKIIRDRLEQLDWTVYNLANGCSARGMSYAAVYQFMKGDRDVEVSGFMTMLDVLGMELKPGRGTPEKPKRVKEYLRDVKGDNA